VRLLLDQNLSDRLLRVLEDPYPGSIHVRQVGLSAADDADLWTFASSEGLVIVSKDSDFHQRSLVHGHPPKVVWIRLGNCTTDQIAKLLSRHTEDLEAFDDDPEASFLVLS